MTGFTSYLPPLSGKAPTRETWAALLLLVVMLFHTLEPLAHLILAPRPYTLPATQPASQTASQTAAQTADLSPPLPAQADILPPVVGYALPAELAGKPEVTALRTAHSATYDLGNGEYAQVLDTDTLHYQDAAGNWQPVNPYFHQANGRWLNQANSVQLAVEPTFSAAQVGAPHIGVEWRPHAVEFVDGPPQSGGERGGVAWATPLAAAEQAAGAVGADGRTLRFEKSWHQGVQDQWQSAAGRVEYTMRLAQRPELAFWQRPPDALDLVVQLTLQPGTRLYQDGQPVQLPLETDRALTLVGADGTEMLLHAPKTYEQRDPTQAVTGTYLLTPTDAPDRILLRVRTPWPWLADTTRAYPVIIDPVFQILGPVGLWHVQFNANQPNDPHLVFDRYAFGSALVGRLGDTVFRSIVRFPIPRMPLGTQFDRAYLYALPTGHGAAAMQNQFKGIAVDIGLHEVLDDAWIGGAPVNFDANALAPGVQKIGMTETPQPRVGTKWDITAQAKKWLLTDPNTPDVANHGLLLRSPQELCEPLMPFGGEIANPFCGYLGFSVQSTDWEAFDLANTQDSESDANPSLLPTVRGGLRLIVFYHNDNLLVENAPTGIDLPFGGGSPVGDPPYYKADHLYRLPPLSDTQWQALVVRGLGPRIGPNPPQGPGQIYRRFVSGALQTSLRTANDSLELTSVTAVPHSASYILYNGAGSPFPAFDQNTLVRVAGVQSAEPSAYDIRLIGQRGTLNTIESGTIPKPTPQTAIYAHDSADPLSLYDVRMPVGANSRVTIVVSSDATKDQEFLKEYAKHFSVKLLNANAQVDLITSSPNPQFPHFGDGADSSRGPFNMVQDPASGVARFESEIFPASAGQWALAIAYNGPQITAFTVPECPDEFCSDPPQVVPIRYRVEVKVHSCPANQMPTPGGSCQTVQCPTSAAFPNVTPRYVEVNGMALWSEGEWMAAGGSAQKTRGSAFPAPFIGPPASQGARQAPTVVIIGGDLTYNTGVNPNTVAINNADVLLIKCQPPAANVTAFEYFQVYRGSMVWVNGTAANPRFAPTGTPRISMVDPWQPADRSADDITNETLALFTNLGEYRGNATLRRSTGMATPANSTFTTQWAVTVEGWLSLTSTLALANAGSLERIASLTLGLGNAFTLDTPVAKDRYTPRRFAGVRALNATVTQDASLGGAAKPVRAVILPRGVTIPSEPAQTFCPRSCIDLRAPTELFGEPLNRVWEMPDIHTDTQASTVAYSSEGRMIVYSVDHPALISEAGAANFAQSFSFDAYKATVSVNNEPCEPGQAPGLVIRGETRIAMPNLGSTTDPNAGIVAGFKLCETPPDGVGMREVLLRFESPVGLPIGASGMFLTGLGGLVRIRPEGTRIEVDVSFQTEPSGPGGILRATGKVVIDSQGLFAFKGDARLLGVFDASGSLWVAWNPMDIGFTVSGGYEDWLRGTVSAHMWRGRGWNNYTWLPDNNEMHFTASIAATLQIPAGAVVDWGPIVIPPFDIGLSVALEFGEFCTNSSCTRYEFGIKGNFKVLGESIGLYYGFNTGLDFILGNDDHILIDQYGGAQASPVSIGDVDAADHVQIHPGPTAVDGVALIPLSISSQAETFLVGLGWQAGNPALSLIDPDGVEITQSNAGQHGVEIMTTPSSAIMTVEMPKAGLWQAKIGDLSEAGVEHYKFVYFSDRGQPGAPGNRGAILTPAAPNEQTTGEYTITWQVPDDTPDQATLALYYRRTEVITGNLQIDMPIVRNLPAKTGSYTWDTRRLLAGTYAVKAVIDDGVNELPPDRVSIPDDTCLAVTNGLPRQRAFDPARFPGVVILEASGTVQIVDNTPPDTPTGLTLSPVDGAILARWNPSSAIDAAAYELVWGPKNVIAPLGFVPQNRTLIMPDGSDLRYRIGAVGNGIEYGVAVAAVDVNSNMSPLSPAQFALPGAGSDLVPLMPLDLARTARTSTSASFTWSPGAGPSPAGYRLFYSRVGPEVAAHSVDVTNPALTLNDLETGGYYVVRVAAFNSEGWLSASTDAVHVLVTNGVDGNGDGLYDDWAAAFGVNGPNEDLDGDGLTNLQEQEHGSYPHMQDSDGDGLSDGEEIAAGTRWYDGQSYAEYSQPRLILEAKRLRFLAKRQAGGEAAPQSIGWANAGGGNLQLAATTASAWIVPTVAGDQIQIGVDHGDLEPGFYSGVVRLTPAAGSDPLIGEPACIRVNAWVLAADDDIPQKLNQTIQFGSLPNRRITDPPFTVAATATSGLPVSFVASPPDVCTLAESTVTLVGLGVCTVSALQLGDEAYHPAPVINRSFNVVPADAPLLENLYLPALQR